MTLLICLVVVLAYLLLMQAGHIHFLRGVNTDLHAALREERSRADDAEKFCEEAVDVITDMTPKPPKVWNADDVAWVRQLMRGDDGA